LKKRHYTLRLSASSIIVEPAPDGATHPALVKCSLNANFLTCPSVYVSILFNAYEYIKSFHLNVYPCIRIHYTALNELLLISGHKMLENGWPTTNQDQHGCTSNAQFSSLLCFTQVLNDNQTPGSAAALIPSLSSQSYITKSIFFLTSVEKSLIRRTCVLRANLNLRWTLRYSPVCDSYLYRSKVLIFGEGGVNA
jgi:hypothetical protein